MVRKIYDVLIPLARQSPNWESKKAEVLFNKFIDEGFTYDEISNHPDWPSIASAELLHDILPMMIDEMLKRNDTGNFLIYPMISAIDPLSHEQFPEYQGRTQKIVELADRNFIEKIYEFLVAIEKEPPNGPEQVQRLLSFWKKKLEN